MSNDQQSNQEPNTPAPVMTNFELKQFGAITELAMNKASQTDIPFIFLSFAIVFLSTAVLTIAHPETVSFIAGKVVSIPENVSKIDIYAIFGVTIFSLLGAFAYNRHLSFKEI